MSIIMNCCLCCFLTDFPLLCLQIESYKLNFGENARARTDHGAKSSPGPPWVAATPTHIAAPLSVFLWGPPCPHTQPSLSHSLSLGMGANKYTSRRRTLFSTACPFKIFSLSFSLVYSFLNFFFAGGAPVRSCFGKDQGSGLIYSASVWFETRFEMSSDGWRWRWR